MTRGAVAVARGCGTRKVGGIYAEMGVAPGGKPLREFLLDPPRPIDGVQLPNIGVVPFEGRDGVTHVIDVIGAMHYPNVTDFLEEVCRFGLSRQLPRTFPFERLSPESRIICVHRRAWVENFTDLTFGPFTDPDEDAGVRPCPRLLEEHATGSLPPMCASVWWEDVEGGDPEFVPDDDTRVQWMMGDNSAKAAALKLGILSRLVKRRMPAFTYNAFAPPERGREYRIAAFASFPVSRIAVVRDREGGRHVAAREAASAAKLPVEEVDE